MMPVQDRAARSSAVHAFTRLQVLVADIPPGISAVDCDGSETSLLDCTSSNEYEIQSECSVEDSSANDATVIACGTESTGAAPPHFEQWSAHYALCTLPYDI